MCFKGQLLVWPPFLQLPGTGANRCPPVLLVAHCQHGLLADDLRAGARVGQIGQQRGERRVGVDPDRVRVDGRDACYRRHLLAHG